MFHLVYFKKYKIFNSIMVSRKIAAPRIFFNYFSTLSYQKHFSIKIIKSRCSNYSDSSIIKYTNLTIIFNL